VYAPAQSCESDEEVEGVTPRGWLRRIGVTDPLARLAELRQPPPEYAHLFTPDEWRELSPEARQQASKQLQVCRECVYRNEDAANPHNACAVCKPRVWRLHGADNMRLDPALVRAFEEALK
jgi:hypothetical protein